MELLEQEDEDEPPNKWDKEKLRNEAEVIKKAESQKPFRRIC